MEGGGDIFVKRRKPIDWGGGGGIYERKGNWTHTEGYCHNCPARWIWLKVVYIERPSWNSVDEILYIFTYPTQFPQQRRNFFAPFVVEKCHILGFLSLRRHWEKLCRLFLTPLPTTACRKKTSDRSVCAIRNWITNHQHLYSVQATAKFIVPDWRI